MPFGEHIAAMHSIESNSDFMVIDIVHMIETEILDLQKSQLAQGILETGNPLLPNYHPMTIANRLAAGLQVDFPDLNFTGQHYSNFFIDSGQDWFEITNDDPKAAKLKARYSKRKGSIYGLTDDNLQKVINRIRPVLIQRIRDKLLA